MLLLTFGIIQDRSDDVERWHYVFRHLSHANVLHRRIEGVVARAISFLLLARVADSNGHIPISAGHAFRLWRTLRAEALSAIATMVFVVCRTEQDFALITIFYVAVWSPIRWCHLIRRPGFQRFRRLQRDIRHRFGNVRNAINNPLCCILRYCRTILLKENIREVTL